MNVFAAVRDELTTRQVAEAYGLHVKHNGMCCCPFHGEKNPSMKVDKRFHCFACGEDGDVIDFAAKYFSLSRKDAAEKLADDFRVSYDQWNPEQKKQWHKDKLKPRPKSPEQIYRETEHHFFMVLSDYYHVLKDWKEAFAPKSMDEEWDDRFVEALDKIPFLEQVMDQFLAADKDERKEMFEEYRGYIDRCALRLSEIKEIQPPPSVLKQIKDAQDALNNALSSRKNDSLRNDNHVVC